MFKLTLYKLLPLIKVITLFLLISPLVLGTVIVNSGRFDGVNINYKVEIYYIADDPCLRISIIPTDEFTYYISSSKIPGYPMSPLKLFFRFERDKNAINALDNKWEPVHLMVYPSSGDISFSKNEPVIAEINIGKMFPPVKSMLEKSDMDIFWTYDFEFSNERYFSLPRGDGTMPKRPKRISVPRVGGYLTIPQQKN